MKTPLSFPSRLLLACLFSLSAEAHAAATFTPNNQPTGWVGEVEVTSYDFADGLQTIYKGDFIKGEWSGNLSAFPVDPDGTVLFTAAQWTASDNLDAANYDTGRFIVTMKSDGTKIPFRWSSLSTTQQQAIDNSKSAATVGPNIVNYVRGDRTNEKPSGALYRPRAHVMGDVIHSRPIFVGHPTDPRVYVGANDGMLHAIDADYGTEVFAYVPSFFISPSSANFSNVKALTVDPYVHNYFVDASPNAANVTLSGVAKTILVGGAGAGGKGLYALDVTDPNAASESAAASKILWEITPSTINNAANTAYADLGHTYGVPLIARVSDGTWVAIVGNGYNNGGSFQAVLYIINLADGTKKASVTATVTGTTAASPNGLSSPTAVDTDHDGKIDYVYAGDINGNMWKFDLRNIASPTATKLFTTSPAQAITGKPTISLHPSGGYMVNFATGRMFTSADSTDATTVYYAYGIWDNGTTVDSTKLVAQTMTAKTWVGASGFSYNVRVSSSNAVDYTAGTGQKQGWTLALPAGERVVGDGGLVTNSRYHFTSTNPTVTHAAVSGVAQPQGDNWLNEVDFTTGGGGTDPVFDLDANLALDDADRVRNSAGTGPQTGAAGNPISRYIVMGVISQPIVARLELLSQTYFNTNPDLVTSVATSGDPGISGGHFDFDIYYAVCTPSSTKYSCPTNKHVHEYDDIYDVTGVNMLAPSLSNFNLANAITSTSTQFKILMSNQRMSPATKFLVGGLAGVPVTSYQTTAGMTMASLTTYTRANITSLILALPLDAFQSKDWAGISDVRAGLVPTQTGCVHKNQGGFAGGPWMNGALTLQIVKSTTPDSAVQRNDATDPLMGYRLKTDATSQGYQLAEYTIFWHHPNGKCVGDSGWVKNPAQDFTGSDAATGTPAAGAADPKDGIFGSTGGGSSGGGSGTGAAAGPSSTVVYTFADGSTVTQTTTKNADGSISVTRVYSNGTSESFVIPPQSGGPQSDTRARTGRVSWREMIRP